MMLDLECFGCCSLAFLLYFNTLYADFVYDDRRAILQNPDVSTGSPLSKLFENDFWGTSLQDSGSHGSYRPLCVLSFRLNYLFSGFQPMGYHLVNVLLHVLATGLFVKVSRYILPSKIKSSNYSGSTVAGLFFAAHPIHAEAVAGLVGRADLAACNFFLLSFLCYIKHVQSRNDDVLLSNDSQMKRNAWKTEIRSTVFLIACILFSIAALLTKETGVTVIGVCILYDIVHFAKKKKKQLRSVSLLLLVTASMVLFRIKISSAYRIQFSAADNPTSRATSVVTRFLTFLYLPVFNFMLLIYPNTLSFDWGMDAIPKITSVYDKRNLATIGFYSTLLLIGYSSLKNILIGLKDDKRIRTIQRGRVLGTNQTVLIIVSLIVFPFIPATNLFFYVGFVVAERILYISSAGFCLMIGYGFSKLWNHKRKFALNVWLMCTLFFLSLRTTLRNVDWMNEENLYRSAINVNIAKAYGNLGSVLSSKGNFVEAEAAYKRALEARPNMADVHYNLGILLHKQNKLDEAILSYQKAIHYRPQLILAYLNLGTALEDSGRTTESLPIFHQGIKITREGLRDKKEFENAKMSIFLQLGRLYSEKGRLNRALAVYREAINFLPGNYPAHRLYNILGETLSKLNQTQEAEVWFLAALNVKPTHVPACLTYGIFLAKNSSRINEAENFFKKATELSPGDPKVYSYYAEFLKIMKRFQEAAVYAEKAANLQPDDYELAAEAAILFKRCEKYSKAEFWFRKTIELQPMNPEAYTNFGAVLYLKKKFKESEEMFKNALKLQPNDSTIIAKLNILKTHTNT